jgi:hypothetical protein
MDNRLFQRKAEVIIGKKIATTNAPQRSANALNIQNRIQFQIEKTSDSNSNKAKISIYNISEESRNFLEQKDLTLFLDAGYKNNTSQIFFGDIIDIKTHRLPSNADIITTLLCGTSEKLLKNSFIDIGLKPNATNKTLINIIKQKLNLLTSSANGENIKNIIYKNGYSFSGTIKDLFDELTKNSDHEWNIQDGELNILPKNKTSKQMAVVISPETGLIETPTKKEKGISFECLLNPLLKIGSPVKIHSKLFSNLEGEIVKISKIKYDGDSEEGKWNCLVEAIYL